MRACQADVWGRHIYSGKRMRSTNSLIFAGGGEVHCETVSATHRFKSMPTVPMPSGEMPRNQLAGTFSAMGAINTPLK